MTWDGGNSANGLEPGSWSGAQGTTHAFTAISATSLGAVLATGDVFVLPAHADTSVAVTDDDNHLSGDKYWSEHADDTEGQTAAIKVNGAAAGNGGAIYAEQYLWVQDADGHRYMLVEIEQEGDAAVYYSFHGGYGMPPAGAELTVISECNVSGDWIDFACLDSGAEPAEGPGPTPGDDAGETCADEVLTLDVLQNDSAPEGDALTIATVDGQAISEGGSVTTASGLVVTLAGGKLVFDAAVAHGALGIGEQATETVAYTVEDGRGGSASATAGVTFSGTAKSYADLASSFPLAVSYRVSDSSRGAENGPAALDLQLLGTGDARFDGGTYTKAYCLSLLTAVAATDSLADAPSNSGRITDAADGSIFTADQVSFANGLAAAENLDLINWIVNADFGSQSEGATDGTFSEWEIQRAIWELTDAYDTSYLEDPAYGGGFGRNADVDHILARALANGEGFEAGPGDIATLIVAPDPATPENAQPFLVGFAFDEVDSLC